MAKGSPNKTIVNSLIQTFQKEVKPEKLYDCLSKMDDDLNKAYETLFEGPLPKVDGYALQHLDAGQVSGPNLLSDNILASIVARTERDNTWSIGQTFIGHETEIYLKLGYGHKSSNPNDFGIPPSSFITLGLYGNEQFYLGQNFTWDSINSNDFIRTNISANALVAQLFNGQIQLQWWAPSEAPLYGAPHKALTWNIRGRDIGHLSFDGTTRLGIVGLNIPDDLIYIAGNASSMADLYRGHIIFPNIAFASIPTIDGAAPNRFDGLICIDKTNKKLVYCTNGQRFALTGVSF